MGNKVARRPTFALQTSSSGVSARVVRGARIWELAGETDNKRTAKHAGGGFEDLLKGDPVGSARVAAADERINRALTDAVERHATKDPGVRDILKRASVVCHPESEPQKKIARDTEQGPIPHPSV